MSAGPIRSSSAVESAAPERGERSNSTDPSADQPRVVEALRQYLALLETGRRPDRQKFLSRHADIADALVDCLDGLEFVHSVAPQLSRPSEAGGSDGSPAALVGGAPLGDFRLIREVGRGGMGIVYEAEQMSLRRRVALKVLPFAATMDARHLQRFHNEARAAACLHHNHIVPVYFVGCERAVHFYAMQYIEGKSLAELIAAQRHPAPSEAASAPGSPSAPTQPIAAASTQTTPRDGAHFRCIAEWGIQAAEALEHAHSLGIVHRDIKPSNLLIDAAGKLWITDFGLARTATEAGLTMTGDVVGTLRYMSPEQALAKHDLVDHRSDIYSLGATLYELLTLRPVVDGKDREEILGKITFAEPPTPRSVDGAIPVDLETIVLKALAKEPAERYATAHELAADLERWLRGEPIQARRIGWWGRIWRWCRRNPSLAFVSGLAIAALISTAVVSLLFAFRETQNAKNLGDALADLGDALAASETNRRQSERRLAENYLDQGLTLCEQGEIGLGLHWLVRALETLPEDQVNLEWAIRANLAGWASRIHVLKGILEHQGPVLAVAYSPDGQTILTGSEDGTVRFWEAATGEHLDRDITLPGGVRALAINPDGRTLVTVSGEPHKRFQTAGGYFNQYNGAIAGGAIRFWETATGKPLGDSLAEWGRSLTVAFSPDGQILATGDSDRAVRLRQVSAGKLHGPPLWHPYEVWAIAFSPDGRKVATGGLSPCVRIWETAMDRPSSPTFVPAPAANFAVAWSPDGQRIVTGGYHDGSARIWDAVSAKESGVLLQHRGHVVAAAFSPDGRAILTGSYDQKASLWDAVTGKRIGQPLPHQGFVQSVAISPDGTSFVTGSWDGTSRLWKRSAAESRDTRILHKDYATALAISPDNRLLLTAGSDDIIRLWDAARGELLRASLPLRNSAGILAFSPTGELAASASGGTDGVIQLWAVKSGKLVCQFLHPDLEEALAFSSDGRFLLSGGDKARLWDVVAGKATDRILPHPDKVLAVSFSRDGQVVLTGGSDKTVRLWDAATGRQLGEAVQHSSAVKAVAFSLDDRTILSATENGIIHRWDRDTGAPLGQTLQSADAVVWPRFSPDGRVVLFVFGDRVAQLRDVATGKRIGPPLHPGGIHTIAFSPDSRSLVTIHTEVGLLRRWEIPSPVTGEKDRVRCWIEAITGLELDRDGVVHVLDAPRWRQRQRRLAEMGGLP